MTSFLQLPLFSAPRLLLRMGRGKSAVSSAMGETSIVQGRTVKKIKLFPHHHSSRQCFSPVRRNTNQIFSIHENRTFQSFFPSDLDLNQDHFSCGISADSRSSLASQPILLLALDSNSYIFGPASFWKMSQLRESGPNSSMGPQDSWFIILRGQCATMQKHRTMSKSFLKQRLQNQPTPRKTHSEFRKHIYIHIYIFFFWSKLQIPLLKIFFYLSMQKITSFN